MKRYLIHQYLYIVPLFISAILSLKAFRLKWPKPYRLYASLLIISFMMEATAILWANDLSEYLHTYGNNIWIYNFYILVKFSLLSAIFYLILSNPTIKKILPIAGVLVILFGLLDYLFIHGRFQYNTYSMIITHVCIITLCLFYFRQLLQEPDIIVVHKEPMVWLSVSTFVYNAGSLPFLIMAGFFNASSYSMFKLFFPINEVLNILLCLCYIISFLWKPQYTQPH